MEAFLTSQEVQAAKNARKTAKGALTRVANQLKKFLVLEPGKKYDFPVLDKYSIKADAEKLAVNLKYLQDANEKYCEVGKEALRLKKANEDIFSQFEQSVDDYWAESRKDATILLNLYDFEYKTSLDRYLKNIEEEGKISVPLNSQSDTEIKTIKKKAETDLRRQLNRWDLLKAEWFCLLEPLEKDIESTINLSNEELLKQSILIDADTKISSLKENWDNVKKFQEMLFDIFDQGGLDYDEGLKKMDFDSVKEAKRLHPVIKELERFSVVLKQQQASKTVEVVPSRTENSDTVVSTEKAAPLKMDKISTPKYSGKAEDFASWKERFCALVPQGRSNAEVCVLLEQAIPEGKRYLLRSCEQDYNEMFTLLQKELAPTRDVVNSINLQLSKLERITADDKESDRKFVHMVETIEKIVRDLEAIDRLSAIANCNTIQDIEGKLPHLVKTDWYKLKRSQNYDECTDDVKFVHFLRFLGDYKYIAKDGVAELERAKALNAKSYTALVTGQCMTINSKATSSSSGKKTPKTETENKDQLNNFCIACQDGATDLNVAKHDTCSCDHWRYLSLAERRRLFKCEFHPRTSNYTTKDCKFKKPRVPCKFCKSAAHHSLFCLIHKTSTNLAKTGTVFVAKVPSQSSSLQSQVLLPFVYASIKNTESSVLEPISNYHQLGTLTDNCATDTWITFNAAEKLGLNGQEIQISAGGFGGERSLIQSKLYSVFIKTKDGDQRMECLGVETIGSDEVQPDDQKYAALCQKFKVSTRSVKRPTRVDLLIGQRGNYLHPDIIIKSIDGMKLLDGPLGKTFAGVDQSGILGGPQFSSNFFTSAVVSQPVVAIDSKFIKDQPHPVDPHLVLTEMEATVLSNSLLCSASKDFLNYFKEESVGVDCNPRCGNCQCGSCAIGGKLKSLKEEREYELIKSNLTYDPVGNETDSGPYWRSVLPWQVDKKVLGNNKSVVLGTMNATLRKLGRDPM